MNPDTAIVESTPATIELSEEFTEELENFIRSTVMGQLSGLFKTGFIQSQVNYVKTVLPELVTSYYNKIYKSLIANDEYYKTIGFDKLMNHGHVELCLLHALLKATMNMHENIYSTKLEFSNYNEYMDAVDDKIDDMLETYGKGFTEIFNHTCKGKDIRTFDPKKDLFIINT